MGAVTVRSLVGPGAWILFMIASMAATAQAPPPPPPPVPTQGPGPAPFAENDAEINARDKLRPQATKPITRSDRTSSEPSAQPEK